MTGDTVPVDIRKPVVGSSSCGPYYLTDCLRFASEGRESLLNERYTCHSTNYGCITHHTLAQHLRLFRKNLVQHLDISLDLVFYTRRVSKTVFFQDLSVTKDVPVL